MTHDAPPLEDYLTGIADAADRLASWCTDAGLDAPVPTCPGWNVRDLLAHQGMVHRWAAATLRGEDPLAYDDVAVEAVGRTHGDPTAWLRAGADDLLTALREAPDDLRVMTFLKEAPPARRFWARRQLHETTIHALDALSAREQRLPVATDAWFGPSVALDGVDELLVGFWQRARSGPRADPPYVALVAAASGDQWELEVGPQRVTTHRGTAATGPTTVPQATISGTPVDLYLALWNRGGRVDDPAGLLGQWRASGAITW
jgi:uncharacterized protein (TIGR03083 family)